MVGNVLSSARYRSQCCANQDKIHLPIFAGLVVAITYLDFMQLTTSIVFSDFSTKQKRIPAEELLSGKVYQRCCRRKSGGKSVFALISDLPYMCMYITISHLCYTQRLLVPVDIVKVCYLIVAAFSASENASEM